MRNTTKQPEIEQLSEFTSQICVNLLLEIENLYTETLKPQDKEWEETSKRQQWSD